MMLMAGLLLGALFGAALQLAGATSHTLIVNALRLRDFRIIKLILSAIAVGLMGVHLLDSFGLANMNVKDLYVLGIIAAGAIFGMGFALTGYCPGTALAAVGEGKPDAAATVAGGILGALVFVILFPELEEHVLSIGRYGPLTLQGEAGVAGIWLAIPIAGLFAWAALRLPGGEQAP